MIMQHILVDQDQVEPSCSVLLVSLRLNIISICTQKLDDTGLYYLYCRIWDSLVGVLTRLWCG